MKTTEFLTENEFIAQDADQMHKTHQHSMLREECYHLAVNAVAIHKLLGAMPENEPVMAWAAEYISLANDHIKSVKEFLEYNDMESDMDSDLPDFDPAHADAVIAEGLEDDILAMAKKISPNARIRGSREEEIARRDAMMAKRAQDHANAPAQTKPELSADDRAALEAELAELMPKYNKHYQMIDNYTQHKQAERIADRVHQIQNKLKQGVAEGGDSYTVANDPDKPGMYSYKEIGHALQSGHSDNAKIYKNNKFLDTVGNAKKQGVAEENLNELSPKTLGSYINKANKDVGTLGYGLGDIKARPGKYKDSPETVKAVKHAFNKRIKGVEKATNRLTKQQGVAEDATTTWEVCFDYGPHMSDTVRVKAKSEEEAIAKVEKAAEKRGRSIDINWAKPAEPGVAEGDNQEPKGRIKSDGTRSHSTYGSRDGHSISGPDLTAKTTTPKKVIKKGTDILDRAFKDADKEDVQEGSSIMQGIRIQENATGGATGAGSVGAVVKGLGEMPNAIIKRQKAYTNQRTKGGPVKLKKVK